MLQMIADMAGRAGQVASLLTDDHERRACRLVGLHRSTKRYRPVPGDYELRLTKRMNELADRHPRYGYRRIWAYVHCVEGFSVNKKRVLRVMREPNLLVKPNPQAQSQADAEPEQTPADQTR